MRLNCFELPGNPATLEEQSSPAEDVEDSIRKNIDFDSAGDDNIAFENFAQFSDYFLQRSYGQ